MRVAWVQDINPMENVGGAQMNDRAMISWGMRNRGVDVDVVTPQNGSARMDEEYDLVVLSNCARFSHEFLERMTRFPFVVFHHDYFFCKWRLFYPGEARCRECGNAEWWGRLFSRAEKNVFLSPLHRRVHEEAFGPLPGPACIPSAVDTKFWTPDGRQRTPGLVVGVNELLPFKGRYATSDYAKAHPDKEFLFIGVGDPLDLKNCRYEGHQSRERLRESYRTCESFIHLPRTPQPFERVAAEAFLCGARIIHNELVGFFSYDWPWHDREAVRALLAQAEVGFWDEIFEAHRKNRKP